MKQLLPILLRQLPKAEIHGLGAAILAATLALLGYYEYVGNEANADKVLAVLLGLILPAAFRSRNTEDSADAAAPTDTAAAPTEADPAP